MHCELTPQASYYGSFSNDEIAETLNVRGAILKLERAAHIFRDRVSHFIKGQEFSCF